MRDLPSSTVEAVLDHAFRRPPGLASGRLVSIDGPSGGGKTTLATALAAAATARGVAGAHVVHVDDLLDGWDGLSSLGGRLLELVVAPLAAGEVARYRRYDWESGGPAEEHLLAPTDLLVLDGVGSGDPLLNAHRATLVWVEVDPALGLARAVARDGEEVRQRLLAWQRTEAALFARDRTRQRADLRVDADGRLLR